MFEYTSLFTKDSSNLSPTIYVKRCIKPNKHQHRLGLSREHQPCWLILQAVFKNTYFKFFIIKTLLLFTTRCYAERAIATVNCLSVRF